MFNFKKTICIIKKSVSVMLSAALCLNLFSATAMNCKKVVLLGSEESGKTELIKALTGQKFSEQYIKTYKQDISVFNSDCVFQEISGNYENLPLYLDNNILVILTIPVNETNYKKYLNDYFAAINDFNGIKVKIVITKTDLGVTESVVMRENINDYVKEYFERKTRLFFNVEYEVVETSAKTGTGIDILRQYINKKYPIKDNNLAFGIGLGSLVTGTFIGTCATLLLHKPKPALKSHE